MVRLTNTRSTYAFIHSCRPPNTHIYTHRASFSALRATEYFSEVQYSFFQNQDWRIRKTPHAYPIFLPSRAPCGELGFKPASLIMGCKDSTCFWLEGAPLQSKALLSPPPSCFSPSLTCHRKWMQQEAAWGQPRINFTMCNK